MKKILSVIFSALFTFALLVSFAPSAQAAVDDVTISLSAVGTAGKTGPVYVVRGDLKQIVVTAASGATGTVTVTSGGSTLLNVAGHVGTVAYFPRSQVSSAGNTATNFVDTFSLAGPVTGSVLQTSTTTNNWDIRLIYNR